MERPGTVPPLAWLDRRELGRRRIPDPPALPLPSSRLGSQEVRCGRVSSGSGYFSTALKRKNRFWVEPLKVPGATAVQLTRSLLCSTTRLMSLGVAGTSIDMTSAPKTDLSSAKLADRVTKRVVRNRIG